MSIKWSPVTASQSRRAARILSTPLPYEVELRWPNALGDAPIDAVGKPVRLTAAGTADQMFVVAEVQGEKLILRKM